MMKCKILFLVLLSAMSLSLNGQTYKSQPTFEENFDDKVLKSEKWGIDITEFKGHNVFFTDRNYKIKRGILSLQLKKEMYKGCSFTSSSIWTKTSNITFGYGKLMVRAKIPAGKECRPAIWLKAKSNDNGVIGEIDLLEHWPTLNKLMYQTNFHLWGNLPNTKHQQYPRIVKNIDITKWHVYSVEMGMDEIVMTVDGKVVATWTKDNMPIWPKNIRYQLYLSLACSTWSTNHVAESKSLPQEMQVDWIKYYELKK